MLTDHDKTMIDQILQDKEKDIVYRDWTRRVRKRVKKLTSLNDETLV